MHVDPHLIASLAHTALEQIADTEFFADLCRALVCSFHGTDRRVRSHVDALNFRELGGNFIRHAIAEISAVRLRAEVLQRQYGDRWLDCDGFRWRWSMRRIPCNPSD